MVYDDKVRYTMRIDRKLLDKFGYIAEYEGRTKNREIEQMMKRRIADFEKEFGEIEILRKIFDNAKKDEAKAASPFLMGSIKKEN